MPPVERIIDAVLTWAKACERVRAVALVGSHARGAARPDSDIDLVLLAADPDAFRADPHWLEAIDWKATGMRPSNCRDARYGTLWSRHVTLDGGPEVEFAFDRISWANCAPVDAGTRHVVRDGCRILYDPDGLLAALKARVSGAGLGTR